MIAEAKPQKLHAHNFTPAREPPDETGVLLTLPYLLLPTVGSALPTQAMSAGGSTGGSTDYVWIKLKLVTAKEDSFAKIFYSPGKDVSDSAY